MIKVQCECKLYVFSFLKNKILNFRQIENYYWNKFPTEIPSEICTILQKKIRWKYVSFCDGNPSEICPIFQRIFCRKFGQLSVVKVNIEFLKILCGK